MLQDSESIDTSYPFNVVVFKYCYRFVDSRSAAGAFFLSILTFIILYNNLVPISLIVTLEVRGHSCTFFYYWVMYLHLFP